MEQGILISLVQSRHSINNMPFFVKNGDGDCRKTQRIISPWEVRTCGSKHRGLGSEGIHASSMS